MKEYLNLNQVLSSFSSDYMFSFEEAISDIYFSMERGRVNKNLLEKEIIKAINNPDVNWMKLIQNNKILTPDELMPLSNEKAKTYLLSLLSEFLPTT